jgi:hypothetical protein
MPLDYAFNVFFHLVEGNFKPGRVDMGISDQLFPDEIHGFITDCRYFSRVWLNLAIVLPHKNMIIFVLG